MDRRLAAMEMMKGLSAYSPHAVLDHARSVVQDPAMQDKLGPWEHRAFAREFTQDSPAVATASLPFAIPLYSAGKTIAKEPMRMGSPLNMTMQALARAVTRDGLGLHRARTPGSLEEVKQGYIGIGEGLLNKLRSFGN